MPNEPAFPTHHAHEHIDPRERILSGGMSLRDWFAGQAITMCLKDMNKSYCDWATEAYAIADAMMAQREKTND